MADFLTHDFCYFCHSETTKYKTRVFTLVAKFLKVRSHVLQVLLEQISLNQDINIAPC